jgi:cholesterol transport system auxiliary component
MNYLITLLFSALLAGCSVLPAPLTEDSHRYLLDARPVTDAALLKNDLAISVSLPTAWPGFDTPQMAYLKKPPELAYFATHRWVDTPSHMLRPLIAQALAQRFGAVTTTPGAARLRLDTELIRLQQDFTVSPSRVQLALLARLIDIKEKRVIAEKRFDESEYADSDDPYGGAVAANRALQRLLNHLSDFCIDASTSK